VPYGAGPEPVTIWAEDLGGSWKSGEVEAMVMAEELCPVVEFARHRIGPGDTVSVAIKGKKADGTIVDFRPERIFDLQITEGEEYGVVRMVEWDYIGSSFEGVRQPFEFIAVDSLTVDSAVVQITGYPSLGGGGGGGDRSIRAVGDKTRQVVSLKKGSSEGKAARAELLARMLADNACEDPVGQVVVKRRTATKIELRVSASTVTSYGNVILTVILSDPEGQIRPEETDAKVNFHLGSEGEPFGTLENATTGTQGMNLVDVSYSQAAEGSIAFLANGQAYNGRFPLGISLGATTTVNGTLHVDVQATYLSGANTTGVLYLQGNSTWKDSIYDNSEKTISKEGCALSCIAMVLKAYGVNVDPGGLNAWMKKNAMFDGTKVLWKTIGGYEGSPIRVMKPVGEGLGYDDGLDQVTPPETLPSLAQMDATLSSGLPVIAQVLNPDKNNQHWIVVTGKTANGDYTILDPGGKTNRVTLSSSYKTIYRYVPLKLK
jgi:hypothetical protein